MKWIYQSGLAASALLLFMWRNAFKEKLKHHTVELETKKPFSPFQMLFISDIHRRTIKKDLIDFPVDLIVIGGDLAEKGVPLHRIDRNLKVLSAIAPVYFMWGNNDREVGEEKLRQLLHKHQIHILENESVSLFGEAHVKLVGIDYFGFVENGFEKAFANVSKDDTVIFVSHTPFVFNRIKEKYQVHLLLGGHTHGGQIRFGPLGLYEKGALTEKDGKVELVSNGFGTTTLPFRLGAEAEFHLFSIYPKLLH
ncbi:metallophosphoesterase [Planococcus salinus]|uniref:Phosphoesterase n=1 Tax=Planococcus salinus TaxID=1848460 RepID=A0A3M8P9Z5_9BACL|nr:metallophosphoesterase [Planococcus salinus]RNF40519.1 phosphoesterase [Planococcus salinus]